MNPYEKCPAKSFWKLAVGSKNMFSIEELWDPKFQIGTNSKVVTYGSCFAQHIGRSLKERGFKWLVTETPPFGMSVPNARIYNYEVFSARTGNIYTTSLLNQWVDWAIDPSSVPGEVWEQGGRYYDPFRPSIEPSGFETEREVLEGRLHAIESFRDSIIQADYFVFTMGLTECWYHAPAGYEYPLCPGTLAGEFDPETHAFRKQEFSEVRKNLGEAIEKLRGMNPSLKFVLTVSPVPLTATNSRNHVLVATMLSKSVLRAVAGQLAENRSYVDYFPSYEIINSPVFGGVFFESNKRSVSSFGVKFVMDSFFSALKTKYGLVGKGNPELAEQGWESVCEEELLGAFGPTQ